MLRRLGYRSRRGSFHSRLPQLIKELIIFRLSRRHHSLKKLRGSPLDIWNAYCEEGKTTDAVKFASILPDLAHEPQCELTITSSVHCDLTLLLHSMAKPARFVKIGVSKYCCWLCEK